MKKYIALLLMLVLVLTLAGCTENAVLSEPYTYEVASDIHALDIRVGAADFTIKYANTTAVVSNLKYLSISEKDGVLTVVDEKTVGVTYKDPILILYIPVDTVYERIDLSVGAAKLTADTLAADRIKLQLGAGDVSISDIHAKSGADILGGAGRIIIRGVMNNLELEMGAGELNLEAALLGDSHLSLGVGESNLILIGNRDDYAVEIEKGIGSVTVDGKSVADFGSSGTGKNCVQIKGGVGAINLSFQEADNG